MKFKNTILITRLLAFCAWQLAPAQDLTLSNNTTVDMVWIPPGTFIMGSPASEPFHKADEFPQTRITLTKGFWLGKTVVTIGR
jgi:formylglycine-generating enzyme required for sulfatase activity